MRTPIVAIVVASAIVARADDARTPADAERLAREGEAEHDDAKLVACGNAYLDLYNHDPAAPHGDALLFNAAICFEGARSFGAAVQALQSVRRSFPRSSLLAKTLVHLAQIAQRSGRLADAAASLEDYARSYTGEHDAYDAMIEAARLRGAIGDDAKRIQDVTYVATTFGAKRRTDVAAAMLGLVEVYTGDAAIDHLRSYLRQYGSVDPVDAAIASAKLGALLWTKSCPVKPVDGLCMTVARAPPPKPGGQPTQCGSPPPTTSMTIVVRDAALAKEAAAALAGAERELERQRSPDRARYYHALAKRTRADADLERYLAMTLPANLDLHAALGEWMKRKEQLGTTARSAYEAVLPIKDASASVASAARIGQIAQTLAIALANAEIPKALRARKDAAGAYCSTLAELAAPLATRALDTFDACLDSASAFGIDDEWSRLCARGRAELEPAKLTTVRELQPDPVIVWPVVLEKPARAGPHAPPDFADALAKFDAAEHTGWSETTCRQSADRFAAVARKHATLAAAAYMIGLSLHRCGRSSDARAAYERAGDPASLANLGALDWAAGRSDAAEKSWQAALAKDGKLVAARLGLAIALHRRAGTDRKLVDDADFHLASALAVDDSGAAAIAAALRHRAAPKLAAYFLDEAAKRDAKSVALQLARGALHSQRALWPLAREDFEAALTADPSSTEARIDLASVLNRVQRFQDAWQQVASLKQPSYELYVARGIALRGLGKLADAEAAYRAAIKLDDKRALAHFDLGVLEKEYVARSPDVATKKAALDTARAAFRSAAAADGALGAKELADACDRAIAAL